MQSTDHPASPPASRLLATTARISLAALAIIAAPLAPAQFVPGEGGALPDIPALEETPGQISGLRVVYCNRQNNSYGDGTHPSLDLDILPPSFYGASGYHLQYSPDGLSNWNTEYSTSSDANSGFRITHNNGFYRLLTIGGPHDGEPSNVVHAPTPLIETRFSGWGLNSSMFITGVMQPWVGYGMTASFSVAKLSDGSPVTGGLSYQWFRVNPLNADATPIEGATDPTYVTTEDDLGGYYFICTAIGDQETVGGYAQAMSDEPPMIFNKSFASNITSSGFTLNLHKCPPSLATSDLKLSYWEGAGEVLIPVTGITAHPGNASFDITATIPAGCTEFNVSNESHYWMIGEQFGEDEWAHQMRDLWITIPAGHPTNFPDWCEASGVPADRRDPLDRNGPLMLQNLCAYAMGLDPMTTTLAEQPDVTELDTAAGTLHVVFRRAKDLTDVTLTPRVSPDLTNWVPATIISETILQDEDGWQTVDAFIDYGGGPAGFLDFMAETTP